MLNPGGKRLIHVEELRARLSANRVTVGTFLKLHGLEAVELAHQAGLDFGVLDLEHSQLGEHDARQAASHAAALGFPVIVRLPVLDAGVVNRLLEAGAAGIQLSSVRNRATSAALAAACRYAPEGTRSISVAHPAASYGAIGLEDYLATTRAAPPLVVAQIETATTDDSLVDTVAAVDVVFIGLSDLSVDLGVAGQFGAPRVLERIDEIAGIARDLGQHLGAWVPDMARARSLVEKGARYIVVGSDVQLLQQGLLRLGSELRTLSS